MVVQLGGQVVAVNIFTHARDIPHVDSAYLTPKVVAVNMDFQATGE
jgi:hypothetical protein